MSKKFKRLLVPEGYRHYWSKYPEGYTILEALLNWVDSVNQLTENVNDWNIYLDDFVENFDEKLRPTVREMLSEMETDGRLAEIINEEIFSWKADKTYVDDELAKKSDLTYVDDELDKKANTTYVDDEFDGFNTQLAQTMIQVGDLSNDVTILKDPLKSRSVYVDFFHPTTNQGVNGDVWIIVKDENNLIPVSKEEWEIGSISGSDGSPLASDQRIRNIEPFEVSPSTEYELTYTHPYSTAPFISVRVFEYDSSGAFVQASSESWVTNQFNFTTATNTEQCVVIFKWTNDADIVPDVVELIKPNFKAV